MAKKKTTDAGAVKDAAPAMVTVIVLKPFRDKETKRLYKAGERVTISKARKAEILKKGEFVE